MSGLVRGLSLMFELVRVIICPQGEEIISHVWAGKEIISHVQTCKGIICHVQASKGILIEKPWSFD